LVHDNEIVCMSEECQGYAESIENRLLALGFNVDILFPNSAIPAFQVIGSIAARGVRFALCIYRHHTESGTVDINILQGNQEAHNNITVEQALTLLTASSNLPPVKKPLASEIRNILDYLMESKPLTIMEVDKMIKYLVTEREASLKQEYGDNIPRNLEVAPVGPVHDPAFRGVKEDLQSTIMEIFKEINTDKNNALLAAIDDITKSGGDILKAVGGPR